MTFCAHSHLQTDRATCVQVHGTTHKVQRGKRLGFLRLSLSTISVLFVPLLRHAIADNDAVGSDDTLYEAAAVLCVVVVFMMMLASLLFHEKNKCINGTLKMPPLLHVSYACISRWHNSCHFASKNADTKCVFFTELGEWAIVTGCNTEWDVIIEGFCHIVHIEDMSIVLFCTPDSISSIGTT